MAFLQQCQGRKKVDRRKVVLTNTPTQKNHSFGVEERDAGDSDASKETLTRYLDGPRLKRGQLE